MHTHLQACPTTHICIKYFIRWVIFNGYNLPRVKTSLDLCVGQSSLQTFRKIIKSDTGLSTGHHRHWSVHQPPCSHQWSQVPPGKDWGLGAWICLLYLSKTFLSAQWQALQALQGSSGKLLNLKYHLWSVFHQRKEKKGLMLGVSSMGNYDCKLDLWELNPIENALKAI